MPITARKQADTETGASLDQEASVKVWTDRIGSAKKDLAERKKKFELYRKYVRGEAHDDGAPGLVRANLVFVAQATIVPRTYAKNPEIAVTPTKAVGPEAYKLVKQFAATLEIVLKRMFVQDTRLKWRVRSNIASIMTTGEGWLKMLYQRDWQSDPVIQARIQDAQDNLAELEQKIRNARNVDRIASAESDRYELQKMIEGLQQNAEVVAAEGLVIDRIRTEDMLVLDKTLFEFDRYVDAEALAHGIWMSRAKYEAMFGWSDDDKPTLYTTPEQDYANHASAGGGSDKPDEQFVRVWEVWHRAEGMVRTLCEGRKAYCREPYVVEHLPERWYPFFRMGWNFTDGSFDALPDVALQKELQDEYNRTRTAFAEDRENNKPVQLVRGGGALTQDDLDNIRKRKRGQLIVIEGQGGRPLSDDIVDYSGNKLDPMLYDVSQIRADLELVTGRGDADSGTVQEAKTATEAEILSQGLASRSEFRQDTIEDGIAEMAHAASEMLLQELTPEQVEQIAGPGYVWPQLSTAEVFNLVNIEIRAGSSGKPNRQQELERWEKLLPLMQAAIQQVFELRMNGQFELAEANIKLVAETLKRFDERIDIEEYFGPQGEEGQAQAQQMAAMQQQVQQLQQALEQAQQQLQGVDQQKMQQQATDQQYRDRELALKEQDYARQAEERKAQQAERVMRDAEGRAKERQAQGEAGAKYQFEREKLDREDARAERDRQFQREQADLQRQVESLQQLIETRLTDVERRAEQPAGSTDEAVLAMIERIDEVSARLGDAEKERKARLAAVTEYLKGERTPEALAAALQKMRGKSEAGEK